MKFRLEHFITNVSGKYPRLWALKGANPIDVRRRYGFRALTSICTIAPCFWEISELPDWVLNAVVESWHNNPHLKRGDKLEIKFITVARKEMKPKLMVNLTEDEISTRRAWGSLGLSHKDRQSQISI
ncbi:hypothetical protein ACS0TY_017770 [Phlomoides rotata]